MTAINCNALFCLPRYQLLSQELMRFPLRKEGQIGSAKTDPTMVQYFMLSTLLSRN